MPLNPNMRKPTGRKPSRWRWEGEKVTAMTKSEARAMFKKWHRLRRLPVGANVVKEE